MYLHRVCLCQSSVSLELATAISLCCFCCNVVATLKCPLQFPLMRKPRQTSSGVSSLPNVYNLSRHAASALWGSGKGQCSLSPALSQGLPVCSNCCICLLDPAFDFSSGFTPEAFLRTVVRVLKGMGGLWSGFLLFGGNSVAKFLWEVWTPWFSIHLMKCGST